MKEVLPKNVDVRFPFTNRSTEVFKARWAKKEYTFPSMSTIQMLGMINDATPLELQGIRKKFAREWAVREFFKGEIPVNGPTAASMTNKPGELNSIHQARTYSDNELAPYIQMCLIPLPIGEVRVADVSEAPLEETLHRDEEGALITEAISKNTSLRKKALES